MKELRCWADCAVWRIAFGSERQAMPLGAGFKAGVRKKGFHGTLIAKADSRFDLHLAETKRRP